MENISDFRIFQEGDGDGDGRVGFKKTIKRKRKVNEWRERVLKIEKEEK